MSGFGTPEALHSIVIVPASGTRQSAIFLTKVGFLAAVIKGKKKHVPFCLNIESITKLYSVRSLRGVLNSGVSFDEKEEKPILELQT